MPTYTYDSSGNGNTGEIYGTPDWHTGYAFPGAAPETADASSNANTGYIYGTPDWRDGNPFEAPWIHVLLIG